MAEPQPGKAESTSGTAKQASTQPTGVGIFGKKQSGPTFGGFSSSTEFAKSDGPFGGKPLFSVSGPNTTTADKAKEAGGAPPQTKSLFGSGG